MSLRTQSGSNLGGMDLDDEIVPSSLAAIPPILRVANEVEPTNPRVAFLCRFYAFEKAHKLDRTSSGHGVREFKNALLQRLEREGDTTLVGRGQRSDTGEMQSFYQHYNGKYIQDLQNADKVDRTRLTKAYQTAAILSEVLEFVNQTNPVHVAEENVRSFDGGTCEDMLKMKREIECGRVNVEGEAEEGRGHYSYSANEKEAP